jgi:hypothetical protein
VFLVSYIGVAMARDRLTALQVKRAHEKGEPVLLPDGAGLYLRKQSASGTAWTLRYRFGERDRWMALGSYPDVELTDARKIARAIEMTVYVVRAFVQLREILASSSELGRRFAQLEIRLDKTLTIHDEAIAAILSAIRQLMHPPVPKRRPIGSPPIFVRRCSNSRRYHAICLTTAAESLSCLHSKSQRCRPQSCVSLIDPNAPVTNDRFGEVQCVVDSWE